jgi:hypothetical protein
MAADGATGPDFDEVRQIVLFAEKAATPLVRHFRIGTRAIGTVVHESDRFDARKILVC